MMIDDVHQGIHTQRPRKRIGRGIGSGHGKTSGRGHKGARSRAGYARHFGHEGGQMPLFRRVAKRGFNNNEFAVKVSEVNVGAINDAFDAGTNVTPEMLVAKGLAKGRFDVIKVLGDGEVSKNLSVTAHRFSAGAEQKLTAAGGSANRIDQA